MDRFSRIYKIHRILSGHRLPVPHRLLQEKLECSRATVNRIISEMRLFFAAPIEYDRERNGYHYALQNGENFELPGLWFSAGELHALLSAQQLLEQAQPGLLDKQLLPLRDRIEKLLNIGHAGSADMASRVRILRMAGRSVEPENFQLVAGALLQRQCLAISYHARGDDSRSRREISPQRLVHYRDNWYLDAWCHSRNALRSFALERITAASVLPRQAIDLPNEQLDAHFAGSYGIFAGIPRHTAVLRFSAERSRWVADEEWHPKQQSRHLPDGGYELSIPYSDSRELIMDILKHGPEVEVISPDELRQEIATLLQAAMSNYRK